MAHNGSLVMPRVAVIGAGIVGLMSALHLAQNGFQVHVMYDSPSLSLSLVSKRFEKADNIYN